MKDKTTAALLAFFLGGFGVHRFYLGQTGKGILYLVFFWTLIPALVAFVDFIIFLTMAKEDFDAKYNPNLKPATAAAPSAIHVNVNQSNGEMKKAVANITEELQKLHDLKEKGILTDEEFAARKKKLIED